jgi:hypothetical protein
VEHWPGWWRGVARTSVLGGLEFDFAVERTEAPREMEGRASGAYNHDVVMRWGGEGLARELDCNFLAAG